MPMGLEDQFRTMYEDRMIERLPLIKNPDYLTSGTRLLDAHKQVAEVDEALRTKAKEFETKMEVLKLRKSLVEQKDLQLKKTLEKFEKYLMENDSKRARAEKKYGDEKELTIVKDKEILRLLKDSEKLTAQRNVLLHNTKNHRIYYRYMLRVQGVTDEYNELRDIIARYETLYTTHQELIYQQQISIDLTEAMKNELKIYEEEKQSEKIRHTLKLIELQNHMEKVKNIAFRNEMMLAEVTGLVNQQNSNLGTMLLSIENIRDLMIMFYGRKLVEDQMTVQEAIRILPAIGEFVRFMSDVVAMVKKEMSSVLPPPTGCKSPPRNSNEATGTQTYRLASN